MVNRKKQVKLQDLSYDIKKGLTNLKVRKHSQMTPTVDVQHSHFKFKFYSWEVICLP